MSKAQFYDPKQLRAPGEIHFQDIDEIGRAHV